MQQPANPLPVTHDGWLIESELPLKPLDSISPYREGITVERPEPVGNYKILDGRYFSGLTGRLFELFTDGVPTTGSVKGSKK